MIEIEMSKNRLRVKGHARADEGDGYAKVCGAATMLAYLFDAAGQTTVNGLDAAWIVRRIEPGDVELQLDSDVVGAWALIPGVRMLTEQYPQFVREVGE